MHRDRCGQAFKSIANSREPGNLNCKCGASPFPAAREMAGGFSLLQDIVRIVRSGDRRFVWAAGAASQPGLHFRPPLHAGSSRIAAAPLHPRRRPGARRLSGSSWIRSGPGKRRGSVFPLRVLALGHHFSSALRFVSALYAALHPRVGRDVARSWRSCCFRSIASPGLVFPAVSRARAVPRAAARGFLVMVQRRRDLAMLFVGVFKRFLIVLAGEVSTCDRGGGKTEICLGSSGWLEYLFYRGLR